MSTISGVGSSSSELIQMLQQMSLQNGGTQGIMGRGERPASDEAPDAMMQNQLSSFAEAAGLDSEAVTTLQEDVESAVTEAIQETDGSSDPREAVEAAIQGVLDEYGLDGGAFLSQMETARNEMRSSGMGQPGLMGRQGSNSDMLSQMLNSASQETDLSSLLSNMNISLLDCLG